MMCNMARLQVLVSQAYAAANSYGDYGYEDMPSKRFGMGSRTNSRLLSDFDVRTPLCGLCT